MFVMGGKGEKESHVFKISLHFTLWLCYWEVNDSGSLTGFRFQVFSSADLGTSETNRYCISLLLWDPSPCAVLPRATSEELHIQITREIISLNKEAFTVERSFILRNHF
jgi:hypothetical protein